MVQQCQCFEQWGQLVDHQFDIIYYKYLFTNNNGLLFCNCNQFIWLFNFKFNFRIGNNHSGTHHQQSAFKQHTITLYQYRSNGFVCYSHCRKRIHQKLQVVQQYHQFHYGWHPCFNDIHFGYNQQLYPIYNFSGNTLLLLCSHQYQ